MRKFVRRDKNHIEIAKALQSRGVHVEDLAEAGKGMTDIITHFRGYTVFIEIKVKERDSYVHKSQVKFLANWPGYCGFARTEDEAYSLATDPAAYALSRKQKDALLVYHETMSDLVRANTLFKLLAEV